MIFIFFTVLSSFPNEQKTVILLFVSSLSLIASMHCSPYCLRSLNVLDIHSNYTALITIFAGSLYILDISEEGKNLIFFFIVLFNSIFVIKWAASAFDIFVFIYEKTIFRFCPSLLNIYAIMKKTNHETTFTYNLAKYGLVYGKNFFRNIREYSLTRSHT